MTQHEFTWKTDADDGSVGLTEREVVLLKESSRSCYSFFIK